MASRRKKSIKKPAKVLKVTKPVKVTKSVSKVKKRSVKKYIFAAIILLLICSVLSYFSIKKDVSVQLLESKTGTVVAGAEVLFNGKQYTSDSTGLVTFKGVRIGSKKALFFKAFYSEATTTISIKPLGNQPQRTVKMTASGEIIQTTVKNRLTDEPIAGAVVKAMGGGQGITNTEGRSILVLPSGTDTAQALVTGANIIDFKADIFNANDATTNILRVMPTGKIYFLQDTGGITVMQTNLDGSNPKNAVPATGYEDSADTQLLLAPQAQFVALKSKRDATNTARLYVYDATTEALNTIEEEQLSYIPVGWIDTNFVYVAYKPALASWQAGREVLKSYNATTKVTTVIDETRGEGADAIDYAGESFESTYILDGKIYYTKKWQSSYYYGSRFTDKYMTLNSSSADGSVKTIVAQWQAGYNAYIKTAQTSASTLNIFIELDGVKRSYYAYKDGIVAEVTTSDTDFTNKKSFPYYYLSPDMRASVWTQVVAGVPTTFSADKYGQKAVPITVGATLFKVAGWYNNDYLLLTNESQQLYIVSRRGAQPGVPAIKIGTYFKPQNDYRLFGYGH